MIAYPTSLSDILSILNTNSDSIYQKSICWGVIKKQVCPKCGLEMILKIDQEAIDELIYKCPDTYCKIRRSIRSYTPFKFSRLPMDQLLTLFGCYCADYSIKDTCQLFDLSSNTISNYYSIFRDISVELYHKDIEKNKLGGHDLVVQIDESLFGHAKYNIGARLSMKQFWVFGMVDQNGKVFLTHVENRKEETLIPFIITYINEGTIIMSDEWKGYKNIPQPYFTHLTVNHSKNFVNPATGAQTQRIESIWNSCKQWLRKKHIRDRSLYQKYIEEWCFRHNLANDFENCWKQFF